MRWSTDAEEVEVRVGPRDGSGNGNGGRWRFVAPDLSPSREYTETVRDLTADALAAGRGGAGTGFLPRRLVGLVLEYCDTATDWATILLPILRDMVQSAAGVVLTASTDLPEFRHLLPAQNDDDFVKDRTRDRTKSEKQPSLPLSPLLPGSCSEFLELVSELAAVRLPSCRDYEGGLCRLLVLFTKMDLHPGLLRDTLRDAIGLERVRHCVADAFFVSMPDQTKVLLDAFVHGHWMDAASGFESGFDWLLHSVPQENTAEVP